MCGSLKRSNSLNPAGRSQQPEANLWDLSSQHTWEETCMHMRMMMWVVVNFYPHTSSFSKMKTMWSVKFQWNQITWQIKSGPICSSKYRSSNKTPETRRCLHKTSFDSSNFWSQIRLSLVTMSTRTHWSKPAHTQSPCLSGLQSKLAMGWLDRVTFCKRLTDPATPTSTPSESFLLLWAGYSLVMRWPKIFAWLS